ncbi:MAG: hypothetical protein A3G34_08395 [Candidatus Lindowbacteria bacterium RIFCSPLOWO2_12_FULL_62_27]|nr:MAG: hypothetical protein A3G34_08395 [Candidatus Lindowbacteria bacterium RIFCSPLOWO2_12_FULL_62_27]OGH62919.1 MAG: hypothetical protein A3I06_13640 [Candidatus Lindowbacteria bacterium RIFCSPLOWO2_02_FULL_62_12]
MRSAFRSAILLAVLIALIATYRKLKVEEQQARAGKADAPAATLADRIRTLPEPPSTWRLLETAPDEMNLDDLPDVRDAVMELLESAQTRVTFESYFLKKSLGRPARWLLDAPGRGIHVLGVVHPNPMSDAPFLDELRAAGAQIIERDFAPLGGNPGDGYIHAKFIIADGARGYLGSANLGAAAMTANREMGLYFEDASIAQTLELMAGFDAGQISKGLSADIHTAVLLQGAADGFAVEGLPRCEEGIAALCDLAEREIDIMMFTFSHQFGHYAAIASPVRAAIRRGVKVRLIHESSTMRELQGVAPTLKDMRQWGVEIRLADLSTLGGRPKGQYHAKAMRVDDEYVMIGSNNWTDAGSHENRETALIVRSRHMTGQFIKRFSADWRATHVIKPYVH